jgi:exodeoxyribonuclease VII small subunit
MPKKKSKSDSIGYAEALTRLEDILESLQEEKVDIDQLSENLKEAYKLVDLCRQKIQKVEMEVQRIDQQFEKKD